MDELEKLAREHGTGGWQTLADMMRFGRAVQATERERCAEICDSLTHALDNGGNAYRREAFASQCSAAIRKG
jgi:hypothetical protein